MRTVLDLLENGDPCSAVLLIALLAFLGAKVVASHPSLRSWGFRTAVCVFIAFCVWRYLDSPSSDPNDLLTIALRGLLAAGLALGVTWILLPVLAFFFSATIASPWAKCRLWLHAARLRSADREARYTDEAHRRREREEYERRAPEPERARLETEARSNVLADAQRRREEARAACELLYTLHAPEIGARFSRQLFDDFIARHLGDSFPPEDVERRAQHLQEVLRQHLEKVEPTRKQTVEGLARWYHQLKQEIEAQPLEQRYKNAQLAQLNARYATLVQQLMQEMEP
jgi:hypothetical protein